MGENVEDQLMTSLLQSQFFSLQLDESTDIGNEANLLCFVRYIYAGGVHDEFLFCRSLPTNTAGEAVKKMPMCLKTTGQVCENSEYYKKQHTSF